MIYEKALSQEAKYFKFNDTINKQVEQIFEIIKNLENHELPNVNPLRYGIDLDLFLELSQHLENWQDEQSFEKHITKMNHLLSNFRQYLEIHFGMWAYISNEFMDAFTNFLPANSYLELMAGNGFISYGLKKRGKSVVTTDNLAWSKESQTGKRWFTKIKSLDAMSAIKKYASLVDAVVLAWSPDGDEIDWQILQFLRNMKQPPTFYVIGEYLGATNSEKFWHEARFINTDQLTEVNRHFSSFDLMNDQVFQVI